MKQPRQVQLKTKPRPAPAPPAAQNRPQVLVPGAHVDDKDVYHQVGQDEFCTNVIKHLPDGVLYCKAGLPGIVVGALGSQRFEILTNERTRKLIDRYMKLYRWNVKKDENVWTYKNCTKDWSGLVLDEAGTTPLVRNLKVLVNYPVYDPDWHLCRPGWQGCGVFYDEPEELMGFQSERDPIVIDHVLRDLVVDFPWRDESSMQNFFGLLLTPIVRTAINGNVPMHLIGAPVWRTGKSILVEQVLGGVILGEETPVLQLAKQDEENDKRILALLMRGDLIVHLDNLRGHIDSSALASLLTASTYQGRMLGASKIIRCPNHVTLVGTGNNVGMSGELAKRTIPIFLQTKTDSPETRTDFVHPDIKQYVLTQRTLVLSCLVGMIENWKQAGMPTGNGRRLGGFDRWSEVVSGILMQQGYAMWMDNFHQWVRRADPEGEDLRTLVDEWFIQRCRTEVSCGELLEMADSKDLFPRIFARRSQRGQLTAFGRSVLQRQVDRPVGNHIIRRVGNGSSSMYMLEDGVQS